MHTVLNAIKFSTAVIHSNKLLMKLAGTNNICKMTFVRMTFISNVTPLVNFINIFDAKAWNLLHK